MCGKNRTGLDVACAKHKMKSICEECNKTDGCNHPEKMAITYPTETPSTATTTMMMNATSPNRNKTIYNSGTRTVASGSMVVVNVVILCIMIKIGYEVMVDDGGAGILVISSSRGSARPWKTLTLAKSLKTC